MTAADLPLDNQLRTTSHLNDLSNFRHVLVGESLMMDSMVLDSSHSLETKGQLLVEKERLNPFALKREIEAGL
jgi:hypothetical protein